MTGDRRDPRSSRSRAAVRLLALAAAATLTAAPGRPEEALVETGIDPAGPATSTAPGPRDGDIDLAIRRGIDFLLRVQNPDGSWGSARKTKGLNIYAPVPGAHHAFRCGDTGLCVSALIEAGGDREDVRAALDRGEAWLERRLPELRRATPDTIYNSWGHAYGVRALVEMLGRHADDAERCERIRRVIAGQVDLLGRYETVDGGWGYLDFTLGSQKPAAITTCFTTATVLIGLLQARDAGVAVPERLIRRATETILRQQKPDFSYVYSESHKFHPMFEVNRPAGSLGRSQACNLALRLAGDERITDAVLRTWLDKLLARNLWLDIGRKRPVPHESWFKVAGYFFYYGHYYASLCVDQLEPSARPVYQDGLAKILLRLQEKDGSWWDYPFYDYHQQYGTAYALMTLQRCRR